MSVIRQTGKPALRAAGWMLLAVLLGGVALWAAQRAPQAPQAASASGGYTLHDAHLHLTNYVQEGTDIHELLKIMGSKVGRVAVFGLPLQQMWDYNNSGDYSPAYYLQSDAPLYYYSFTDAHIAMAYKSLTPAEQARFDPMITGFNPADMYAADHIKRVLLTFPGVFSGIGEFTIHKEFVRRDRQQDGLLLDSAGPHSRFRRRSPFASHPQRYRHTVPKPGQEPGSSPVLDLLLHQAVVIWAHVGVGHRPR
jgi:hypothetical protein